jgi:hypothetical protein
MQRSSSPATDRLRDLFAPSVEALAPLVTTEIEQDRLSDLRSKLANTFAHDDAELLSHGGYTSSVFPRHFRSLRSELRAAQARRAA